MAHSLTVGILGETERLTTWEKYLRPHPSVTKVVLTRTLKALGKVDACIVLDEDNALDHTMTLTRQGIHCFVVGRLPTDLPKLIRMQQITEESGTVLQYSNWAYFNPASLWMMELMGRPRLLHINREVSSSSIDASLKPDQLWIEDLALVLRWINSGIHKIETQMNFIHNGSHSRNTWVMFDNGTSATMFHNTHSKENRHMRIALDERMQLEADILQKSVVASIHDGDNTLTETRSFVQDLPATQAINRFLKSIQMKSRSEYGIFDVVRLVRAIASTNTHISK